MAQTILLLGKGFPTRIWQACLEAAGMEYVHRGLVQGDTVDLDEADVIIETEDLGLSHAHPEAPPEEGAVTEPFQATNGNGGRHPAFGDGKTHGGLAAVSEDLRLSADGLVFTPCYFASPTVMAEPYEEWSDAVIGYTLFSPPSAEAAEAPIIEIAPALQTSKNSWDIAQEFLALAGFRAEMVGDAPGLVFGRTLACLINEAAFALSENLASAEDIDTAMKLGVNYPKGLLEWADELGHDFILDILEGLYAHYQDDRYRAAPLLRHFLLAGRKFRDT